MTLEGLPTPGLTPLMLFFYDGPDPGDSFAMFDGIIPVSSGTLNQPFSSFVAAQATQLVQTSRGTSHTVSVSALTVPFLEAVKSEVEVGSFFLCLLPLGARAADHESEPCGPDVVAQRLVYKWWC